jgi:hypothetical protein
VELAAVKWACRRGGRCRCRRVPLLLLVVVVVLLPPLW